MASITPNVVQINGETSNADSYWSSAVRPRIAMLQTGFYRQGADAANALQDAIDTELTAMYAAITAMKSMRNTQAAIRRLPPEVLTRIFWFCSMQEPPSPYSSRMIYQATELWQRWEPGWMKVSYVCRYWRDAALQDPRLWGSNVACSLPFRWMEETLNRSKLAPASIDFKYRSSKSSDFFRLLTKHLHHTRHLAVDSDYSGDLSPLIEALVEPAPILETLRFEQTTGPTRPLPDGIFDRHAPRLRYIVLNNWLLPSTIRPEMVSRIEHLDLRLPSTDKFSHNFHNSDRCQCSPYSQTPLTLQHMPILRTLKLKMALPPCSAGVFTRDYVLNMPQLEHLELEDGAAEIALLLDHMQIPATTRIKIVPICSTFDEIYLLLAPQLCCRLQAVPIPIQALSISCEDLDSNISIKVKAWPSIPSKETEGNAILDFDFYGRSGTGQNATVPCALHQLCIALSVDTVSWLYCKLFPVADWNRQQLVNLFTSFPMLESLTIHKSTGKRLAMVLASPVPGRKLSANTAILQQLRELTLENVNLGPPQTKSRSAKPGKCEYIHLLEAMRKRKAALGRIPKVLVRSGHMKDEWAEEMRREIELERISL